MAERGRPRSTATLALYERSRSAIAPFARAFVRRDAGAWADREAERRGRASAARPDGPLVWVHASDAPDLRALAPLVERITRLGLWALVTTRTPEAAAEAAASLPEGSIHQLAPIDAPAFADRFLKHWRPDLALVGAGELMPTLTGRVRKLGVPAVLVDGSLSEKSYIRWRRARRTIAAILSRFDLCLARTDADAARLAALGAPLIVRTGDLRFDAEPPAIDPRRFARLKAAASGRPVMVAAGSCGSEGALVARAHALAMEASPDLLTIVAPDGPASGPEIMAAAESQGLVVERGVGADRKPCHADIALFEEDDLASLYRLADVTFLGGSLVRRGGRDPVGPAKAGAAILHGPHVGAYEDIYAVLHCAQGAMAVDGADTLGTETLRLVRDPAARTAMTRAASDACRRLGGALDRTLGAIDPYLIQLRLGAAPAAG